MEFAPVLGYGTEGEPCFWIGPRQTGEGFRENHLAFTAPERASVDAFFRAALATGAEVLHEPRLWPEYHPGYYAAFVRDPDGNTVEAVCHHAWRRSAVADPGRCRPPPVRRAPRTGPPHCCRSAVRVA